MTTLNNDDIQVAHAEIVNGKLEMGPESDRTIEAIKVATLSFAKDCAPYTRWSWGNMLVARPEPDAQLLRVESMACEYRYDHEYGIWWASSFSIQTVRAEGWGIDASPRQEQPLGLWGEGDGRTPQWVDDLVEEYRPSPADAPPRPTRAAVR